MAYCTSCASAHPIENFAVIGRGGGRGTCVQCASVTPDRSGELRWLRDESCVYFMQASCDTQLIKIGLSSCISKRVQELRSISPVSLTLLATTPGGRALERSLHRRFSPMRAHHEWFYPLPELLDYIASIPDPLEALETAFSEIKLSA